MRWSIARTDIDAATAELCIEGGSGVPDGFDVAKFPGLLACEVVRASDQTTRILTTWRSSDAMRLRLPDVARTLAATIVWSGMVQEVRLSASKHPMSAGDAIVRISALIGAATVVVTLFTSWFARPDVVVNLPDPQPVNASMGLSTPFRVLLLNNSRTTAADTDLTATTTGNNEVVMETGRVNLPPGSQATAAFHGRFPSSGDHTITLSTRSRAGLLFPTTQTTIPIRVRVWPPVSKKGSELLPAAGAAPKLARIGLQIATGEASVTSVTCLATVARVPSSVSFFAVSPSTTGGTRNASSGSTDRTITLEWKTVIPRTFEWVPVIVTVENNGGPGAPDWAADVAHKLTYDCEPSARDATEP